MLFLRDLAARLRGSLTRRAADVEMDEEFQFHVDMQTAKNVRLGMPPDEARRRALVSFGGRERHKEAGRDERRSRLLEDAAADLRFALRTLRRSPAFVAIAVLSLALGIGANTAVFSIVEAVLLRPLPYPAPDRLVSVLVKDDAAARPGGLSDADFLAVEQARGFEAFGAYFSIGAGVAVTGLGDPEQVEATWVSAGLLPALGVRPALGRLPLPAEDDEGAARVVVLSHPFWRDHLGASPDVLGRSLTLDGEPYTVIGVMPEGFAIPGVRGELLWPVSTYAEPRWRAPFYLKGIGRLAPGVSAEQARAELAGVARTVKERFPDSPPEWSFAIDDLRTRIVHDATETVLALYVAVALVLLMATANVANLFLARATSRLPELLLRTALGAGRGRLVRQLLTESVLVALAGAAVGLLLATWSVDAMAGASRAVLPRLHELRIDRGVLLFTVGITLLVGVAVGLAPALLLPRRALGTGLREGSAASGDGGDRRRLRGALVVGEFALALAVLVGAGLAVDSLRRLERGDAGARVDEVLVARISIPQARYPDAERLGAFYEAVAARVGALPGVREVGVAMAVPPNRLVMTNPYTPEGTTYAAGESAPVAEENLVSPGYFAALGIPLRTGRTFTAADREGAPRVAIVNETFARRHFPGGAVGRWLQTGSPDPESERLTIVGVVADVKYAGLDAAPAPTIYVPFAQHRWWRTMYVVAHTTGDPLSQARGVRAAVAAVDPQVPVQEIGSMERLVGESVAQPRFRAALLGAFGALALLLAGAGIYGVVSYAVSRRRRETGVRLALGASRSAIVRMVVADGMRLAAAGIVLGAALAALSTRLLVRVLYGVGPLDPAAWALATVFLALVGLAACAIPALRASRTDPMMALRE